MFLWTWDKLSEFGKIKEQKYPLGLAQVKLFPDIHHKMASAHHTICNPGGTILIFVYGYA